ncbi:pyrroline-5-carboxylate reductase [Tenuibacillus multivorans]|uniref:Pyrroline-5-carboxylate reductase n=1 Tax=Tenuibacillus multivorans TaxID=237069 RepID=A0A1H0C413_9BACI|nr:pyrroline-5-carboxylate reductase [Tenuibacillus multivorans]GEL77758.1 pyrroline-5-carboxylate reductase [Tenuibacillus multivorans]SDN52600.1 pyrroline-5-carboxylate reductase [Tenuibacillus multivorans]
MAIQNIGFIGCGKMAQSIINGMITYGGYAPEQIQATAVTDKTISYVTEKFGIEIGNDNQKVAAESDVLYLAVKPYVYPNVIEEVRSHIRKDTIIVTIAVGVTLKEMANLFSSETRVVRTMPNTPAFVGEGMTAYCPNENLTDPELEELQSLFSSYGQAEMVKENLMDAITAVSGSSPAYVYVFIEAMADGAVKQGIPRELAYQLATQAVYGAAKMVMETGLHPGELKDHVTTPNGTTIRALASLEEDGFRGSVIKAIDHCFKK